MTLKASHRSVRVPLKVLVLVQALPVVVADVGTGADGHHSECPVAPSVDSRSHLHLHLWEQAMEHIALYPVRILRPPPVDLLCYTPITKLSLPALLSFALARLA